MEGRFTRGILLCCALVIAWCASAYAGDAVESKVSVTIPAISQITYEGSPVLVFDISAADAARGYSELPDSGSLRWATNSNHWRISASHSAWLSSAGVVPVGMQLQISARGLEDSSHTASGPLLHGWTAVDELPTPLLAGSDGSQGELRGIAWRAAPLSADMKPGIYQTTVTFSLTAQ
jgi:hypothetical protein